MLSRPSISVYCSASRNTDPTFSHFARGIGFDIARAGWNIVYGGGDTGMMLALAEGAKEGGAHVHGVIPHFLFERNAFFKGLDEITKVTSLRERKRVMEESSTVFMALPGGVGTLDEFIEILASLSLDRCNGKLVIVNWNGFYDPLLNFIGGMVASGFARTNVLSSFQTVTDSAEAIALLTSLRASTGSCAIS
jgi:uncharacterized protein (TIGR00730 family)